MLIFIKKEDDIMPDNSNVTLEQFKRGLTTCRDYIDKVVAALPKETFLDQSKTKLIDEFIFSNTTYPGATNPNLDGNPVFVLAVKDVDENITYSFINMAKLVDIYTASDSSIQVVAKALSVKLSNYTSNALELREDGLYVAHTEIKVSAESNNAIEMKSDGLFVNKSDNIIYATNEEVIAMLDEVFNGTGE